jgi:hypothetical protein
MTKYEVHDFTKSSNAKIAEAVLLVRFTFLPLIFMTIPAIAEPIELSCKTSEGYNIPVNIDLVEMKGTWGMSSLPYEITHTNDDYVTMMRRSESPGGEYLVINRATGQYQRAGAYIGCDEDGNNCSLRTTTQEAHCKLKIF